MKQRHGSESSAFSSPSSDCFCCANKIGVHFVRSCSPMYAIACVSPTMSRPPVKSRLMSSFNFKLPPMLNAVADWPLRFFGELPNNSAPGGAWLLCDASVAHLAHSRRQQVCFGPVMSHVDQRKAELALEAQQIGGDRALAFVIEAGERLVHEKDRASWRQRARQRDSLLLTAGKLMRLSLHSVLQANTIKHLADANF